MKKNRPAALISVLCKPADAAVLESILFRETSTLGVRRHPVERHCLERTSETVQTPYGPELPDGSTKRAPEYEDCKRLAQEFSVPLRTVYQAALG